ncbi:hypothetical protein DQ04_00721160 [Trypanosoma grayi]|uniref:hypothetical protein n=1 Tax=Trypanosoma grayi TaxID=71804 RepID=UPI0004F46B6C|nr:hypothetical protein DQ04_00721160 [Trypanosoma grayi]KEG13914.1 hypothetical protein DQ04_00721160 [Trypanosoma grayi]
MTRCTGEIPSPPSSSNDGKMGYAQLLEDVLDGGDAAAGAMQARFINCYDPLYDRPYTHRELNTDRYLDSELCRILEDDRRAQTEHHLQTDKVQKAYMLALIAHNTIMRSC